MTIAPAPPLSDLARTARRHHAIASPGSACFQRDRDLLRATPEFARLRDVTQVMAPGEPGEFHTRHSHSLQVARIGRALAEALLRDPATRQLAEHAGGLNPDVVEAAALAHDLGHPPFGHDAEDELDHLLIAAGVEEGFEANAQTFRVVCALAGAGDAGAPGHAGGLNLTRATLAGILKYPWLRGGNPQYPGKWGAYATESEAFHWAVVALPAPGSPGLEARLMDWADLLAYAIYDFEDFVRSGDIPMDRLRASAAERQWLLDLVFARRCVPPARQPVYAATLDRLLAECPSPASDPRRFRNALRCYANHLVAEAISGVGLAATGHTVNIETAAEQEAVIMLTEGLTWHYVIDSPLLAPQRAAQRQIIRELFLALVDAIHCPDCWASLPPFLRRTLHRAGDEADSLRCIADCIASMPEREAVAYHGLLVGE